MTPFDVVLVESEPPFKADDHPEIGLVRGEGESFPDDDPVVTSLTTGRYRLDMWNRWQGRDPHDVDPGAYQASEGVQHGARLESLRRGDRPRIPKKYRL